MSTLASSATAAGPVPPIDPLAPQDPGGYADGLVSVCWGDAPTTVGSVVTPTFTLATGHDPVRLWHRVPVDRVDDDLAGLINDELFGAGWLRGSELFERVLTGVVRSCVDGALPAWETFYRNTVARIAAEQGVSTRSTTADGSGARADSVGGGHGSIADYAPVHAHAADLVRGGTTLELGSCFGFLSIRLAGLGLTATASDVVPGTMRLLTAIAPRLGVELATRVGDAARMDLPDRSADTVLAVHLLEHLDPDHSDAVLAEALRLASRRVVLGVPLEDVADETYGHVRTVTLDDLTVAGARSSRSFDVHEHHGGWLVIDV